MVIRRITLGGIDAAVLGPSKKQAHGHRREKKSNQYFGCDFSGWYNFGGGGESLKLLPPDVIF